MSSPQWPAALRATALRNRSLLDDLETLADAYGRGAVLDALKAWADGGPGRELADIQQRVGSTALGWAVREFVGGSDG
jgi:hypothetical protein